MTNIYYNVETPDKKYSAWIADKKYLPVGDKCFEEKIYNPEAPRETWDRIVNMASLASHKNRYLLEPQPFIVVLKSVDALQAKDKAHYDKLVGQLFKHGASVYFFDEQALITKENPRGLADNKEFGLAMSKLEAKGVVYGTGKRVELPDLPKRKNIIEI